MPNASGAQLLICNDYELELIKDKTTLSERDLLAQVQTLVITRGEKGATIITVRERFDVPAVAPDREADPTGVGDAYRGGFLKGLAQRAELLTCARLGSGAATYALEHLGGMSHSYTRAEFAARYERHFGPLKLSA